MSTFARYMEDDEAPAPTPRPVDRSRRHRPAETSPWTGRGRGSATRGIANNDAGAAANEDWRQGVEATPSLREPKPYVNSYHPNGAAEGGHRHVDSYEGEGSSIRRYYDGNVTAMTSKLMPSPFSAGGYTDTRRSASAARAGSSGRDHPSPRAATHEATHTTLGGLSAVGDSSKGGHNNRFNLSDATTMDDASAAGDSVVRRHHHPSTKGAVDNYPYSYNLQPRHQAAWARNNGRDGDGGPPVSIHVPAASEARRRAASAEAIPSVGRSHQQQTLVNTLHMYARGADADEEAQPPQQELSEADRSAAALERLRQHHHSNHGGGNNAITNNAAAASARTNQQQRQQQRAADLNTTPRYAADGSSISMGAAAVGGYGNNSIPHASQANASSSSAAGLKVAVNGNTNNNNNASGALFLNSNAGRFKASAVAEAAPFATHYSASAVTYPSALAPDAAAELMDRYGYHYEGQLGTAAARRAEAAAAAQRLRAAAAHRNALLGQIDDRRRREAFERDEEAAAAEGSAMSIVAIGGDAERRAAASKAKRRALEAEWLREAEAKRLRDAAEREALRPWEEDWNILEEAERRRELHGLTEHERRRREEQMRLEGWRSAQEREAEERRATEEERRRIEELTLGENIANYADRIVLAEEQRRRDQQRYREQLDAQVREKHQRKKVMAAEQYALECRLGSY